MKWLPAENELGSEQREFLLNQIVNTENNEKIAGFPGSGKTVVLLYAVVFLRRKNPNSKILIVEFTHALIKMLQAAIDELSKEQTYQELHLENVEIKTYYDFVRGTTSYDYIVCDEVQDIPEMAIREMQQRAKRVIVGGDANQSIYTQDPKWKMPPCSLTQLDAILSPNATNLTIIYRLTKKLISAINSFLPTMNILQGRPTMVKTNVQIRLWKSADMRQEAIHIMDEAISRVNNNDSVGVLVPTHHMVIGFANMALEVANKPIWNEQRNRFDKIDFSSLNRHLKENGIPMQYVANGYGNFSSDNMITLTTYHSSKGLDFDAVMLPFCNPNSMPSFVTPTLFMVAMTRSRKDLFISYSSDSPCSYVHNFSSACLYKDWTNEGVGNLFENDNNNEDEDFDF